MYALRNKYRITFAKYGAARFVGHLDLQTLFQRAIKRAGLPVSFSKGFNPHQLISFGQPLPVGMSSGCELVEIELEQLLDADLIVSALNNALPEGLDAISAVLLKEGEKAAAALVNAADYEVKFPYNIEMATKTDSVLTEIMNEQEIVVNKKTKKGIAQADIRCDIFELRNTSGENNITVKMVLATGSNRNLKPELVAKLICDRADIQFEQYKFAYSRTRLYLEAYE